MHNKFKEKKPEDTIHMIMSLLYKAGIFTTYQFSKEDVPGLLSNHVNVDGTLIGTNGKGTNKVFAMASAYGELMERLQNRMFYTGILSDKLYNEFPFCVSKDEKRISIEDLIKENNAFLKYFFERTQCKNYFDKYVKMNSWMNLYGENNPENVSLPFYSLNENKVVYLPYVLYRQLYGSNGMCAGNTPEEAMVQGLSEIYERYVMKYILSHSITPPTIPEDEISSYVDIVDILNRIKKKGDYEIKIKDLSLNKGYPVVGTLIIDKNTGSFGFRIASHPSLQVAIERTLTEAMQGRTLQNFVGTTKIGTPQEAADQSNIANIFKTGEGYFRAELFYNTPSYSHTLWKDVQGYENKNLLLNMVKPLIESGYDILIRDRSITGFPSFHLIVPGISEMYDCSELRRKELITSKTVALRATHYNERNPEDIKRQIRYIEYARVNVGSDNFASIFGRPFKNDFYGGRFTLLIYLAGLYYMDNRVEKTKEILHSVFKQLKISCLNNEQHFQKEIKATLEYLNLKEISQVKAFSVMNEIFGEELAKKIENIWNDNNTVLEKLYPELIQMKCWDCKNCLLHKRGICTYLKLAEVYKKLAKVESESNIYQDNIGRYFVK